MSHDTRTLLAIGLICGAVFLLAGLSALAQQYGW